MIIVDKILSGDYVSLTRDYGSLEANLVSKGGNGTQINDLFMVKEGEFYLTNLSTLQCNLEAKYITRQLMPENQGCGDRSRCPGGGCYG